MVEIRFTAISSAFRNGDQIFRFVLCFLRFWAKSSDRWKKIENNSEFDSAGAPYMAERPPNGHSEYMPIDCVNKLNKSIKCKGFYLLSSVISAEI